MGCVAGGVKLPPQFPLDPVLMMQNSPEPQEPRPKCAHSGSNILNGSCRRYCHHIGAQLMLCFLGKWRLFRIWWLYRRRIGRFWALWALWGRRGGDGGGGGALRMDGGRGGRATWQPLATIVDISMHFIQFFRAVVSQGRFYALVDAGMDVGRAIYTLRRGLWSGWSLRPIIQLLVSSYRLWVVRIAKVWICACDKGSSQRIRKDSLIAPFPYKFLGPPIRTRPATQFLLHARRHCPQLPSCKQEYSITWSRKQKAWRKIWSSHISN